MLLKKANLLKDLEAVVKSHNIKAYLHFYLYAEDRFKDELDHYVVVKLAVLKSAQYVFRSPYQTWNSNWERMLHDGMYKFSNGQSMQTSIE